MDLTKLKRKQKAVSPIIAVVLLIALIIISVGAVATMIFFFVQTDEGANEKLSISLDAFFDLDGDGAADAAVFKISNEALEPITVANATLGIGNDTISGATWTKLDGIFPERISSASSAYIVISTYSDVQQFSLGSTFVFNFTLANHYEISGTVIDIFGDGKLVFGVTSAGIGAVSPEIMKHMAFKEDGQDMLAEGDPIHLATVTIHDAATNFPVDTDDTNEDGEAIFRIKAGRYNAKISYGDQEIISGDFNYPETATDFGVQNDQAISITGTYESVNVHYSEQDVYTEGATVRVEKKVVIDGVTTEQLLEDSELTDWNGSAIFNLAAAEYRFLAYRGSPIPAMSEWVDISVVSDVYINTEPGLIYVRVLSANGILISNVKVTALGVLDGATTYLGEKYTNASGVVQFVIATPDFKVKVAYGAEIYVSSMYKVVPGNVYDFYLGGNMLTLNASSQAGNPVSNVFVMLYDEFGRYFGSAQTNSSGMAVFFGLSNSSYYLKYYVGDEYFTTDIFEVNDDLIYNLLIAGLTTYASVRHFETDAPIADQYVYIYDDINGTYFGYGITNTSGIATIVTTVAENTSAHLRIWFVWDGINTQSVSELFNITDRLVVTVYYGGETVDVHVQDSNGKSITRRFVYAYNEDDTIHSSAYLDQHGDGVFVFSPRALYTVGIDYGGVLIESSPFNSSETSYVLLEIPLVKFNVQVYDEDGKKLKKATIYLYSYIDSWVLLDEYEKNGAAAAKLEAVEGGTYRVYIVATGLNFYSPGFTISEGITIDVAPLTMTIVIENLAGDPISSQWFQIYNEDGIYAGFATTDSSGEAEIIIFDGESYYIYISAFKFTSSTFVASDGGLETITLDLLTIYVQYEDERGEPFAPLSDYSSSIYYADNSYAGTGLINTSGIGMYYVADNTEYSTLLYINGREVKSDLFNATDGHLEVVVIEGYDLYIELTIGGSPLADSNILLYNVGDQFSGNSITNSSGIAKIQFVLGDISYYLLADIGGGYHISSTFNVTYNDYIYNFTITTVDITIKACSYADYSQGDVGLTVSVYNIMNGSLIAGSGTTDADGLVTITLAENHTYVASIYYEGSIVTNVYSEIFYANSTTSQIDVKPVHMTVQVNDGAGTGVDSIYVRLINRGIISGESITDSSGEADVWANNGTVYYYMVSKNYVSGPTYLSDGPVNGTDGNSTIIDIGGGSFTVLVNDYNGDPMDGVTVYLYIKLSETEYWDTGHFAVTNSTGHASFIAIGAGQYVAYCPDNGVYSDPFAAEEGIVITIDASVSLILMSPTVQILGSDPFMIPSEESA